MIVKVLRAPARPVCARVMRRPPWLLAALILVACSAPKEKAAKPEAPAATKPGEPATITLAEEARAAAGIRVEEVASQAFRPRLLTSGMLRPNAAKSVPVRVRTAGRVLAVLADVGARVELGETLATLEGPDVTGALARYHTAAARESVAHEAAARADRLLDANAISRAERDGRRAEAEAAGSEALAAREDLLRLGLDPRAQNAAGQPAEVRLLAPQAGTVLERTVAPGVLVEKDAAAFVIASLDEVWALMDVYEKDLGQIQEQGEAEVRSDAYPGEVFKGRLTLLEPAVDVGTRTGRARIVLANQHGKLRPGLTVTAELPLREGAPAPAVAAPAAALQQMSGISVVFVETGPGRYAVRPVEVGRESEGRIEIRSGLAKGEKVVVEGAFVLKSELLKKSLAGEE